MKKKSVIIGILLVVLIAAVTLFLFNRKNSTKKTNLSSQYASVSSESCDCETNWFPHQQTPPPEEGDGSPFDTISTTNCIFHQWSWQKFLWLTKPLPNGKPLFLDSLHLVSPEMESVSPQLGLKLVLSSYKQAGSEGVLIANTKVNSGNNPADTVYYSIHVDTKFMNKAILMASLIHNKKLPYSNLETFPVGSLELKVSWINASAIPKEKLPDYFTTNAAVQNNKGQYDIKSMALLGMHVVGVVKNHPEFIWATFEHKEMAPIYDKKSNSVTAENEMLFYEKGISYGLQGIIWSCDKPLTPNKASILYEYGVPKDINTGDYMRTSQSEPTNFNNIDNINKCVTSNLKDVFKNYFYNGSIWLNFDGMSSEQQAKEIVTRKISSAQPGDLARGSVNLANITMETYTQTFKKDLHDINNSNLVSCFTCHQSSNFDKAAGGKSPLYLSHVFESYLYTTKPKATAKNANSNSSKAQSIEETKVLKLKQFQDFVRTNQ
ncbi:hypothetical protein [Flavobacterium salmonis]|uniref:Cytochrome c domain-containing protein n=1 Tax=Flavobacterium salmonis TaxID=2654844 RepID=A0A6V6Z1R0_9FLAO|nr:hypothetical protein [Flavobacterium salmonis]CAD0005671.1 hypothetical protein FLAT13_02891 [Flavobacterium salmonis]